jgi:hypothetical protein
MSKVLSDAMSIVDRHGRLNQTNALACHVVDGRISSLKNLHHG